MSSAPFLFHSVLSWGFLIRLAVVMVTRPLPASLSELPHVDSVSQTLTCRTSCVSPVPENRARPLPSRIGKHTSVWFLTREIMKRGIKKGNMTFINNK